MWVSFPMNSRRESRSSLNCSRFRPQPTSLLGESPRWTSPLVPSTTATSPPERASKTPGVPTTAGISRALARMAQWDTWPLWLRTMPTTLAGSRLDTAARDRSSAMSTVLGGRWERSVSGRPSRMRSSPSRRSRTSAARSRSTSSEEAAKDSMNRRHSSSRAASAGLPRMIFFSMRSASTGSRDMAAWLRRISACWAPTASSKPSARSSARAENSRTAARYRSSSRSVSSMVSLHPASSGSR